MKQTDIDFVERRTTAKNAKAALLEKMKARQSDPEFQARRAEHEATAIARKEREATRQEEKRREEEERQARLAEEKAAAEAAAAEAKQTEKDRAIALALENEALRKQQRDARYAARQARKR